MRRMDAHRIVFDRHGTPQYQECSRWDDVSESARAFSTLADVASLPTEVRLLNNNLPVVVGIGRSSSGAGATSTSATTSTGATSNLARVMTQLTYEPAGTTPMCRQLLDIIEQLRCMEHELRASGKIALLVIMTDCESTDGSIVDVLKPLEGMPLKIVVRLSTNDVATSDYWHAVNSQLDLDVTVLEDVETEASEVLDNNPWVTYSEPLHRLREFGVAAPALAHLDQRQLSRTEIAALLGLLLGQPLSPNPEQDWPAFVEAAAQAAQVLPMVWCPVRNQPRPLIDTEQLARHQPDPVSATVERNEGLLWKIYVFYAYNAAALKKLDGPALRLVKIKPAPVFRSAAKYEKRLLQQDDLWKMMKDFDFVPTIVNTIRFNKLMADLGQRRSAQDKSKVCLLARLEGEKTPCIQSHHPPPALRPSPSPGAAQFSRVHQGDGKNIASGVLPPKARASVGASTDVHGEVRQLAADAGHGRGGRLERGRPGCDGAVVSFRRGRRLPGRGPSRRARHVAEGDCDAGRLRTPAAGTRPCGPPGNAVSSPAGAHIQARQPSLW